MITIKQVSSRRDLRKFIQFPNELFKDVPTYIPPLNMDERHLLTKKNPSLDHCDLACFLAYRDNKIVGRVAAIINRSCNEIWNKKSVRFGWFDFIEDYEVFTALMHQVEEYGKSHGMTSIEGPLGFTDMDKECWAIDNFDARQNISTLYNPEYYIRFVERYGLSIACKWQQYKMPANQPIPPKVERVNNLIMERYKLHFYKFKPNKEGIAVAVDFFHTLNKAFKDLYDFVPLTDAEIKVYIDEYKLFMGSDFCNLIVDENNNLVAFGISIYSLNEAYKKAKGRLFPFGWYHIFKAMRKGDTLDLLLNGVHPDWQKRGVHALYYCFMNKAAIEHDVHTAYTNPQIMGNEAVKIWGNQYDAEPLMQRAVFAKEF